VEADSPIGAVVLKIWGNLPKLDGHGVTFIKTAPRSRDRQRRSRLWSPSTDHCLLPDRIGRDRTLSLH